jgi:diadenosine tetraphosphatase ApaH/serine/threonine PP2A family protein phosphatase/Ca2+-binding EF-hand superfamily protein
VQVYGVTYFVAKPNHGTFVDRDSITLYDAKDEAGAIVTDLARKGLDRRRAEREAIQRASLMLDADEENKVLMRRQLLDATLLGATLNRERPDPADVEVWEREAEAMPVEASYEGPHIRFPLTLDQVVGLMEAFKRGQRLHYKYAMQLLSAFRRYASELPTLVEVEVQPGTRMTVCGDTHGQLKDLYSIYTINGVPSPTNRYLMNGDFVDRGEYSCEVVFSLIAWVLLYPGEARTSRGAACLLNRGNHESHNQNMTQGFMSEVLEKYSGHVTTVPTGSAASVSAGGVVERGMRMYDCFLLAFDSMPLSHLLKTHPAVEKKQVFVVHGGLMQSPGVRLAHIAAIRRKREIPYGYPAFEDKLYEDLMWSDPRPVRGTSPNTRGAGVYFGPDITERFCAGNQVSLVVRSHECVQEGYQFMHDGRLVTVFSASQYCGRDTNKGAFIIFEADLNHTIQQYIAGALPTTVPALTPPVAAAPTSLAAATGIIAAGATRGAAAIAPLVVLAGPEMDESTAAAQAENVRRMIMERVIIHKPDLYFFWSKAGGADGKINKSQWADGMRTVLNLDLPWIMLAPSLVEADAEGRISYARFLDRYTIAVRELDLTWMESIIERSCEKLFSACRTLEQAYKFFDADESGAIELHEFERGLQKMEIGLSPAQLVDLMNAIDSDKDGRCVALCA